MLLEIEDCRGLASGLKCGASVSNIRHEAHRRQQPELVYKSTSWQNYLGRDSSSTTCPLLSMTSQGTISAQPPNIQPVRRFQNIESSVTRQFHATFPRYHPIQSANHAVTQMLARLAIHPQESRFSLKFETYIYIPANISARVMSCKTDPCPVRGNSSISRFIESLSKVE